MKEIIEKLLQEVDSDIREVMLKESSTRVGLNDAIFYKNWELLDNPVMVILSWQQLRRNDNLIF